jgi:putative PEP-CTERM system TPR-repeat lipoprotein
VKGIKWNKTAVALAISVTLSMSLVGCGNVGSKTDKEHVIAAKDFLDKDDLRSGVIELKSALQKNPENIEARRLLGELSLKLGDGASAEKELRRAMELGVAKEAILISLASALEIQGKYQKILDEIEASATLLPSDRAVISNYRGDAWLIKNELDKAEAEFNRALEEDSKTALAYVGLARIAAARSKNNEAKTLFLKAAELSPDEPKIWSYFGAFQVLDGDSKTAEKNYTKAISLGGGSLQNYFKRALLRIELDEIEAAQKDAGVLKKDWPKTFQANYVAGVLTFREKKFPEAQIFLDEALKYNSKHVQATFYRGVAHLAQNHLAQADQDISRVYSTLPDSIKVHQIFAQIKFNRKDFGKAKELLQPVLIARPDDVFSLGLMGQIETALGNISEGNRYLEKVIELKPNEDNVIALLGMNYLASGDIGKGIERLQQIDKDSPQSKASQFQIVLAYIRTKDFDKASEAIDRLREESRSELLADNLSGLLHRAKGQGEEAKRYFKKVLAASPGNSAASLNLAEMAVEEKDFPAAYDFYDGLLKAQPRHLQAKLKKAELLAKENRVKELESVLISAIGDHPTAIQPKVILSAFYIQSGQPARAQTILGELKEVQNKNPQVLSLLAKAQLQDKQPSRALKSAKRLVELSPKSAQSFFTLAQVYEANRDLKNMRTALEQSLKLRPNYTEAKIALVKLCVVTGESKEANKLLSELIKETPSALNIVRLQGWVALKTGQPKKAILFYEKAFEKVPSTNSVTNLARAQWQSEAHLEGQELLKQWNEKYPKDLLVRYLRSEFYTQLNENKEAIIQLEEILTLQPNNAIVLNDLAWQLKNQDKVKALSYAEKAYELSPSSVAIIDTLAMILLEHNQYQRAVDLLERVAVSSSAPVLQYHLALALDRNGQSDDSINKLKELLSRSEKFKERKEAELLLKRLEKSHVSN